MTQSDKQLKLLVAGRVLEIAATLRQESIAAARIDEIEDPAEREKQADFVVAQNSIAAHVPTALKLLQEVEQQIEELTNKVD